MTDRDVRQFEQRDGFRTVGIDQRSGEGAGNVDRGILVATCAGGRKRRCVGDARNIHRYAVGIAIVVDDHGRCLAGEIGRRNEFQSSDIGCIDLPLAGERIVCTGRKGAAAGIARNRHRRASRPLRLHGDVPVVVEVVVGLCCRAQGLATIRIVDKIEFQGTDKVDRRLAEIGEIGAGLGANDIDQGRAERHIGPYDQIGIVRPEQEEGTRGRAVDKIDKNARRGAVVVRVVVPRNAVRHQGDAACLCAASDIEIPGGDALIVEENAVHGIAAERLGAGADVIPLV